MTALTHIKPNALTIASKSISKPTLNVIEPGLLLYRNFVPLTKQKEIAENVLKRGFEEKQFLKTESDGSLRLNSDREGTRGRTYSRNTEALPYLSLFNKILNLVKNDDYAPSEITHVIEYIYKETGRLPAHQDTSTNDGNNDFYIISGSLGLTADFVVYEGKPKGPIGKSPTNRKYTIPLESGDILLFGGPCRYIWHSVENIRKTIPLNHLPEKFRNYRFNYTGRFTPELIGRELEFNTSKTLNYMPKTDRK